MSVAPDTNDDAAIRERARREVIALALCYAFVGLGFGCSILALLPSLHFATAAAVCFICAIYCFCQISILKSGPSK